MNLRVVKVGGSLFTDAAFPHRLRTWLNTLTPCPTILVAGGGEMADVIRQWDQRFSLHSVDSHWLCIDVMRTTAKFLAAVVPEATLVEPLEPATFLAPATKGNCPLWILDPTAFVQHACATAAAHPAAFEPLPCDWTVTSDSIAARFASEFDANELILLKSIEPNTSDAQSLAEQGIVDEYFPRAVRGVRRWRICQLK